MKREDSPPRLLERMACECIAVRVRLLNRVISALYDDAMRPHGVRISQGNILVAVGVQGEVRPAELCRALRIEKSTLSRDVELIKQQGWIESNPPQAGRNHALRLTPAGRQLLAEVQPAWERAQAEAQVLLGESGVNALHRIAARLGFGKPPA
jgi:DNA-binding MarR family transcriptional regulator